MAHNKLSPDDDEFLTPMEVIRRLKNEFRFVQADKDKGKADLQERIWYLQELKSEGKNPFGMSIDKQIALHEERLDSAVNITFSDDAQFEKGVLNTTLVPDEPIFFGYTSRSHEEACWPLVQRCAKVLGYEIVE
jgi:hypothetical protein